MTVRSHPYSTFLRSPSQVLPDLAYGDVLLERRDEDSIIVTSQERYTALMQGMEVTTRIFRSLFKDDCDQMVSLMTHEMPWLAWLPEHERRDCVNELLANLAAGAETGALEPFSRSVLEWQHTAEVWADPELAKRLSSQFDGDGPVLERPGSD
jgi:hypothetical protein